MPCISMFDFNKPSSQYRLITMSRGIASRQVGCGTWLAFRSRGGLGEFSHQLKFDAFSASYTT